jgi:nucleoside diphosphate kinase
MSVKSKPVIYYNVYTDIGYADYAPIIYIHQNITLEFRKEEGATLSEAKFKAIYREIIRKIKEKFNEKWGKLDAATWMKLEDEDIDALYKVKKKVRWRFADKEIETNERGYKFNITIILSSMAGRGSIKLEKESMRMLKDIIKSVILDYGCIPKLDEELYG